MPSLDHDVIALALSLVLPYALVLASPGPNLLVILRLAMGRSLRPTLAGALGLACGAAITATIACHGARLVGCAEQLRVPFAILLAMILIRSAIRLIIRGPSAARSGPHAAAPRLAKAFGLGIAVALANPISLTFFFSFFVANRAFQAQPWMAPAIIFAMAVTWFASIALLCQTVAGRAIGPRLRLQAVTLLPVAMIAYALHILVSTLWTS